MLGLWRNGCPQRVIAANQYCGDCKECWDCKHGRTYKIDKNWLLRDGFIVARNISVDMLEQRSGSCNGNVAVECSQKNKVARSIPEEGFFRIFIISQIHFLSNSTETCAKSNLNICKPSFCV